MHALAVVGLLLWLGSCAGDHHSLIVSSIMLSAHVYQDGCGVPEDVYEPSLQVAGKQDFLTAKGRATHAGILFVAFRGTLGPDDWICDAAVVGATGPGGLLHACVAWRANSAELRETVRAVKVFLHESPSHRVVITGHSLGGAVAAAFGIRLLTSEFLRLPQAQRISVIAFGSPLLGDESVAQNLEPYSKQFHFFVVGEDPVPRLLMHDDLPAAKAAKTSSWIQSMLLKFAGKARGAAQALHLPVTIPKFKPFGLFYVVSRAGQVAFANANTQGLFLAKQLTMTVEPLAALGDHSKAVYFAVLEHLADLSPHFDPFPFLVWETPAADGDTDARDGGAAGDGTGAAAGDGTGAAAGDGTGAAAGAAGDDGGPGGDQDSSCHHNRHQTSSKWSKRKWTARTEASEGDKEKHKKKRRGRKKKRRKRRH